MWAECKGAIGIVEEPNLCSKGAIATPRPEGTGERKNRLAGDSCIEQVTLRGAVIFGRGTVCLKRPCKEGTRRLNRPTSFHAGQASRKESPGVKDKKWIWRSKLKIF